jgi:energy-coupling factor transporter ATP-binding protein EcfA2
MDYIMIEAMKTEIEQLRGQKIAIETIIDEQKALLETYNGKFLTMEEARRIAQEVAKNTQDKLKLSLEPIVTSAMEVVFGLEAYGFDVAFEVKRNKTECTLSFTRDGQLYTPLESSGFGAVDVATFALRLAIWNISKPRGRSVLILDEPFKHLSEDLQERVMDMAKILSHKLGIQLILVTHTKGEDVMEHSDRVFKVEKRASSTVRQIK